MNMCQNEFLREPSVQSYKLTNAHYIPPHTIYINPVVKFIPDPNQLIISDDYNSNQKGFFIS